MEEYNYEKLREDLIQYYSTAAGMGIPRNLVEADIKRVSEASEEELLSIAEEEELDMGAYKISR